MVYFSGDHRTRLKSMGMGGVCENLDTGLVYRNREAARFNNFHAKKVSSTSRGPEPHPLEDDAIGTNLRRLVVPLNFSCCLETLTIRFGCLKPEMFGWLLQPVYFRTSIERSFYTTSAKLYYETITPAQVQKRQPIHGDSDP